MESPRSKPKKWRPWRDRLADLGDACIFVQGFVGYTEKGVLLVSASGLVAVYFLHQVSQEPRLDHSVELEGKGPISSFTSDTVDSEACPTIFCGGHVNGLVSAWSSGGSLLAQFTGHSAPVTVSKLLGDDLATGSMDGTIRLWCLGLSEQAELSGCRLVLELGLRNPVADLALLSSEVLVASWDGQLRFLHLEAADASCVRAVQATMGQARAICKWDDAQIFAGTDEGVITCWAGSAGGWFQRLSWQGHWGQICSLSPCKTWLISLAEDKLVRLWDAASGRLVADFWGHNAGVLCSSVLWPCLWTGSRDHSVRSWDLEEIEGQQREAAAMEKCDKESLHYELTFSRLTAKQLKKLAAAKAKAKNEKRRGNARR